MNTKLYILCMTVISITLIAFGLVLEDSVFRTIFLLVGGVYFGHIATITLNHPTEESL